MPGSRLGLADAVPLAVQGSVRTAVLSHIWVEMYASGNESDDGSQV